MILDNYLMFTGTSNGATAGVTSGANTDAPTTGTQVSSNVIDLGLNGIPLPAQGGGARDIGVGDNPAMKVLIVVTTAMGAGTSLQVNLQGAPDNLSGLPGSYTTMWSSPVILLASLTAGAQIANIDMPRPVVGQPMPRFLRLQYVSAGTFTSGAIEGTLVIDRFDQPLGTTGLLSGYPAGINVAN